MPGSRRSPRFGAQLMRNSTKTGAAAVEDAADDPEIALEKKDKGASIRKCLAGLSPQHREIIDLVYYHEKSVLEGRGDRRNSGEHREDTNVLRAQKVGGAAQGGRYRKRLAMNIMKQERRSSKRCCHGTRTALSIVATPTASSRLSPAIGSWRGSYELVREELAETIHLNETLGAPSARVMEKLFAAIDADEARSPRRRRSFDLAQRISGLLSAFTPRTLAWTATAAALAILVEGAIIAPRRIAGRRHDHRLDGSPACQRAKPGLLCRRAVCAAGNGGGDQQFSWRVQGDPRGGTLEVGCRSLPDQLAESPLASGETGKIIRQMQEESRIIGFIAAAD